MKPSDILTRARDYYLWDGHGVRPVYYKERYICHAVGRVQNCSERALKKVYDRIDTLLGPTVSYESWLARNHPLLWERIAVKSCDPLALRVGLQANRLRWINDMIAYFKAKGE